MTRWLRDAVIAWLVLATLYLGVCNLALLHSNRELRRDLDALRIVVRSKTDRDLRERIGDNDVLILQLQWAVGDLQLRTGRLEKPAP